MIQLDDLSGTPSAWRFDDPVSGGAAMHIGEVLDVIAAAERRVQEHSEWVVLVLTYEAAPAFDAAMATKATPPPGVPFVWWQSFRTRQDVSPIVTVDGAQAPDSCIRRPNLAPFPDAVRQARSLIERGDIYQVNLTDRFEGTFPGAPFDTYQALIAAQRCAFGAYIEMDDRIIASASPELFFEWDRETITCRPMKGTAPRHPRPAEDLAAGEALRASEKDRAENVMIVDLLRNDLGRLATTGSVDVPALFDLERYPTVWQLTSTVRAEVRPQTTLADVFGALFPCGSVTGAPKIAAMAAIDELEAEPRGVYCGAIGLLAPPPHQPRAVFSVPIRTAVLDRSTQTYEYGAGGGITWSSSPEAEDQEVLAKTQILTTLHHQDVTLLETLRNDESGLSNADQHLDRMEASAQWFGIPFDRPAIEAAMERIGAAPQPERVRLTLGSGGALTVERVPLEASSATVTLAIDTEVTRSDDPYCCHKTTNRRHYDCARARHPEADDVVLVNERGQAIETTIANLAYQLDGRWYCPPLSDGGLPGIARANALAEGRLAERSIQAADLAQCEAIAVLNDLRGWRPAMLLER